MRSPGRRGRVVSLLLCCHPLPAAAVTVLLTVAAALTGRGPTGCALVAVTVLSGQLTIGWVNDVVDRDRDRGAGRRDKPLALGWIEPRTVVGATAVVTVLLVPLSLANGTAAGLAHLGFVACGWLYDLRLKGTALSWLPYVVGFGLLPAFLSYGGLGLGAHGGPPTVSVTLAVGLLAFAVHFLNALPDLAEDTEAGVRHLPLLVAQRVGAPRLLAVSAGVSVLAAIGLVIAALTVGVRR